MGLRGLESVYLVCVSETLGVKRLYDLVPVGELLVTGGRGKHIGPIHTALIP